jgi:NADH-quinone oxidoreductase subunit N
VFVLAQVWISPHLDLHALAPELILVGSIVAVILLDLFLEERSKWITSSVAGFGLLASFVPIVTFALSRDTSSMFDGAYVVDDFALVLKALFLLSGYVVVLMSSTYIDEGDYYEGEYYTLLLSSILGMVMMSSSRDLISIFIALELLSIPGYILAAWRKRDTKSNEAGVKYYLLGVFASSVMLYGMSLLYGQAGSTVLTKIAASVETSGNKPIVVLAVVFIIVGFAFKVSAVPFHTWAPDTYEGAPTPVTAFLSVASKAAGFVALLELVFVAFPSAHAIWQPFFWTMAALSMTVGNVVALRQTNMVRMLAYSSIAQGGFILMPLAAANDAGKDVLTGVITYLLPTRP